MNITGLTNKKVLETSITISPIEDILEKIIKYLKNSKNQKSKIENIRVEPLVIYTPNPEIITYAQQDKFLKGIVQSAQINIPDGWGIIFALKKIYNLRVKRISGVDLMYDLCDVTLKQLVRIGLIGGKENVALTSAECLKKIYKGIKITSFPPPKIEIGKEEESDQELYKDKNGILSLTSDDLGIKEQKYFKSFAKYLLDKRINLLFVAFGFPKQEYFIYYLKKELIKLNYPLPLVLMGVGGAFDYLSGRVKRAPKIWRNNGLEWLYRLIMEPWRIKRQFLGAKFFYLVLRGNK